MRKLDKRGFWMGEESGKFILGVIAVVLLILLMAKLIGIMRTNTQLEQAKNTLEGILDMIKSLEEGKTETLLIESPKNWYLMNFGVKKGRIEMPQTCGGQNCLCICKRRSKEGCEKEGICKMNNIHIISEGQKISGYVPYPEIITQFVNVPLTISFEKRDTNIIFNPIVLNSELIWDSILLKDYNGKTIEKFFMEWIDDNTQGEKALIIPNGLVNEIKKEIKKRIKEDKINAFDVVFDIAAYENGKRLSPIPLFEYMIDNRNIWEKLILSKVNRYDNNRLTEIKVIGDENKNITLELNVLLRK